MFEAEERLIYAAICSSKGIKAKDIAKFIGCERKSVNHYLYSSPLMKELCWEDKNYRWHGIIQQCFPHYGLGDFCGYYSAVKEFMALSDDEWFAHLLEGCRNNGRNLNDTRGLFHSFRDEREVMVSLFHDLSDMGLTGFENWEICFELRIKKSRYIRIYCDVLLITPERVFNFEFKMKNEIIAEELQQAFKYCRYLDIIFGNKYEIIPVLVLSSATDFFDYANIADQDAAVHVCSGNMIYNVIDTYYRFLL